MFPFTEAAKRIGAGPLNIFRLVLAVILLSIGTVLFSTITLSSLFSSPTAEHWFWLGISGLTGLALGDYFSFSAFAIIGTRLTSVFVTLAPAAALLFGSLINHEQINIIGITGMMITIAGIMWLSLSGKEKNKISHLNSVDYSKGIFYAILSAVTQGIGVALSQRGLLIKINNDNINPIHASLLRMLTATAGVVFATLVSGRFKNNLVPIFQNKNNGIKYAVAGTVFGPVIGMALSMQAVSMTGASVAQTLFSLLPVFVIFIAHFFYNERITYYTLLAALMAVAGVIILIWRESILTLILQ